MTIRNLSICFILAFFAIGSEFAEAKSLVSAAAKLYKKYGLNHTSGNNAIKTA